MIMKIYNMEVYRKDGNFEQDFITSNNNKWDKLDEIARKNECVIRLQEIGKTYKKPKPAIMFGQITIDEAIKEAKK